MPKSIYVGEMMRALDAKYGDAFDVVLNAAVKSKEYRNIERSWPVPGRSLAGSQAAHQEQS